MCKLAARDVELRTASLKETKYGVYITLLAYKDARVDMRMLDKMYGPMNWQRKHKQIGDTLYCCVSVWDKEKQCWVEKEDVGTESNTEKVKGESSDSFKRACFNWGIGRELYAAPNIRFKLEECEVSRSGKITTYAKFRVAEMEYDEEQGIFTKFKVVDASGNTRFDINAQQPVQAQKTATQRNIQEQEKKPARAKQEPEKWVKQYNNRPCVFIAGKWHYFDTMTNGSMLAIVATDAQGMYTEIREAARKRLQEKRDA